MTSIVTLPEMLRAAAGSSGRGIVYINQSGADSAESYAELLQRGRVALGGLRERGYRRGQLLPLLVLDSEQFVALFWGCQLGGIVPVPLAPPSGRGDVDEIRKLVAIWEQLGRPRVVCSEVMSGAIESVLGPHSTVVAESLLQATPADTDTAARPDELALIQFSSGSTGEPKGVMLTHGCLLSNVRQMAQRIPLHADSVELGWMPHYHDMGLIGSHLTPIYAQVAQVRMDTIAFLKHPEWWFDAASRHGATVLSGTNTALRLVLRRVKTADPSWCLRQVEAVLIGAEPVSGAVLRAFAELLEPAGLRRETIRIAYGLAEASVGVCFPGPDEPLRSHWLQRGRSSVGDKALAAENESEQAVEILASGPPFEGTEVRIVDDGDQPLPDGVVGHIQARGPQVFIGYHQQEAATAAAHCGSWLRTGDLGFVTEGRLAVCGRTKELLFSGGRNVYAQDIEQVATEVPGVRAAVACASPAVDGTRELTLLFVSTLDGPPDEVGRIVEAAARRVRRVIGISVDQAIPIVHREIPKTSSGKVRRYRLAERFAAGEFNPVLAELEVLRARPASPPARPDADALETIVRRVWAQVLGVDAQGIGTSDDFRDLGGTSAAAQEVLARLEDELGRELGQELVLTCSSISQMVEYLRGPHNAPDVPVRRGAASAHHAPVAIVGMACRFPGASSVAEFWRNLTEGRDLIRDIPAERWSTSALDTITCRWGGFVDDPYAFDNTYFGIAEDEAVAMDPQQRLLLELAVEALETAGFGGTRRKGLRVGVFVGASQLPYQEELGEASQRRESYARLQQTQAFAALSGAEREMLRAAMQELEGNQVVHSSSLVGNLLNMLAARISHELDLQGPALALDTACSASLVAVHEACESLRRGECDLALAGGVSLNLSPALYRYFEAAGALARKGRSRAFSARADGFVPGEGGGLLLLRLEDQAVASANRVHALLRGAAVNNDGRSIGAMAPNPEGQLAVLEAAYHNAGVDPASIGMVECHGTGTEIGDPIEIRALSSFLKRYQARAVSIGSVKSNIGHLLGAAGIAGLIKAVLALQHRALPPSLHAEPPHPRLRDQQELVVQTSLADWPASGIRRAGVSAFGFGGTNCHIVAEEAPGDDIAPPAPGNLDSFSPLLITLSAPTTQHLAPFAAALASQLRALPKPLDAAEQAAVCAELRQGRAAHPARAAKVLGAGESLVEALEQLASGAGSGWRAAQSKRRVRLAWLFPGQGSQFVRQSLGLYEQWPEFRRRFQQLCSFTHAGHRLVDACYGSDATDAELRRTDIAQPLLVAFQIAMSDALRGLGLEPVAVLGHSVGEFSAACIAGAIEPKQAMQWAELRGQRMQELPDTGGMIAVIGPSEAVEAAVRPFANQAAVAAYNAPNQTVVAGDLQALAAIERILEAERLTVLKVPVAHAFHAPQMAPAAARFATEMGQVRAEQLRVAMMSTVTGAAIDGAALTTEYWRDQVCRPVRFTEALRALAREPVDAFVEIGPGATLTGLVRRILAPDDPRPCLPLCQKPEVDSPAADRERAAKTMSQLWLLGAPLTGAPGDSLAQAPRPALPSVPFLHKHLRLRPPSPVPVQAAQHASGLGYAVHWAELPPLVETSMNPGTYVVLGRDSEWVELVDKALRPTGARVVRVAPSPSFMRLGEAQFALDPSVAQQLRWLVESLGPGPLQWIIVPDSPAVDSHFAAGKRTVEAIGTLSHWMRALAGVNITDMCLLTRNGQAHGEAAARPEHTAMAGFALAACGEIPGLRGRVIDLDEASIPSGGELIAREIQHGIEPMVALRGGRRYSRRLVAAPMEVTTRFSRDGVFVLIGGAGGVGSALVRELAARADGCIRIILAGRRKEAEVANTLESLRQPNLVLEYVQADAAREQDIGRLVQLTLTRHGRIDGVFHLAGTAVAGSVARATDASLREVLGPKVEGAMQLARALENVDVKFVALSSSASAFIPSWGTGLASYAAANAFLDGLASVQRSRGLPWTSIGSSLWRQTGLGTLADGAGDALGIHALEPAEAARGFIDLLGGTEAHRLLLDPRDAGCLSAPSARGAAPSPQSQAFEGRGESAARSNEPSDGLSLETFIRQKVASAAGLLPEEVDPDESFQRLGVSSLAAVDLMKELEALLGDSLPTTLLFEHNTISKVLSFLGADQRQAEPPLRQEPLPRDEALPLLPAQQTFYANQQFYPGTPCYVFMRLELEGEVNPSRLDRALQVLFARHPMLRVVFAWENEQLVQRPGSFACPKVEVVDLSPLAREQQEQRVDALDEEMRNAVMQLGQGPLFRLAYCKGGDSRGWLLFNIHHIIADAWSAQILVTELLEAHRQLGEGEVSLAPLQTTFAQCAESIAVTTGSADGEDSLNYWRSVLRDPPPHLALPFDGDPTSQASGTSKIHQVLLDAESTSALELLARKLNGSLFQLVFTAYLHALRTWSGQNDIVVRVANARREERVAGISQVVGCFADSLPVRARLEQRTTLRELLEEVRRTSIEAQRHPLTSSMQVATIHRQRPQGGPKGISPAGLSFPSFDAPSSIGSVRVLSMRGGSASGFTQLGLIAWKFDGKLHLSWNYNEPLFRAPTIEKLAEDFMHIVRHMVSHEALPKLVESETRATTRPLPPGDVVHQRILQRIDSNPSATAIQWLDRRYTYAELGERALKLAEVLRQLGAGRGALVGILAHPSFEATVGLLGILSSGAAYVPISPDYPDVRIRQIAEHAELELLVTTSDQISRLPSLQPKRVRRVVLLDDALTHLAAQGAQMKALEVVAWRDVQAAFATEPTRVSGQDLAYVMYTSGTTGQPKGVMVQHEAVSMFHDWVHQAFAITSEDRFIQTSSLSFGGSIRQVYSPLLAGATVYPVPRGLVRDPFALVEFLERNKITIWNSVPTLWMRLLECIDQHESEGHTVNLDALRWILIGGEHVPAGNVRRWIDRFGMRHRIANLYGSTETVVNATWHVVERRPADDELHTPIGRARHGSEVVLLTERGERCTQGDSGELYVGGASLAAGYLNAPEETKAAFVAPRGYSGRYYRTGDLARELPDGQYVYLGRRDTQVKVRGNRVELSEIEGVLGLHPRVKSAAVIEHSDAERQWLVAFVQPAGTVGSVDVSEVREHVARHLPDYMVPHRIEAVEALPLTAAGKLDRRALLDWTQAPRDEAGTEPQSATERAVAEAFREVLKVPRVHRDDDFFDIGGDSILALQMFQRLRRKVDVLPRPITLYSARTVAALARAIDAAAPVAGAEQALRPGRREPSAHPLSASQESFVLAERANPGRSVAWCAQIPIRGSLHEHHMRAAVDQAVRRHPMLRAIIVRDGLRTQQQILEPRPAPIEFEDLRKLSPVQVAAALERIENEERRHIFPLDTWPLWRMRVCRVAEDRWAWFINVHHAIGDGWSLRILGSEILRAHDAMVRGQSPDLAPLRSSYLDAIRYVPATGQEHLKGRRHYWRSTFGTPWPDAKVAVADTPDGNEPDVSGTLDETLLAKLLAVAKAERVNLHALILTAWFRVVSALTACSELTVGVATSGRDVPIDDIEGIVGCFAAGLPIRASVGGASFRSDLHAVSEAFSGAYERSDIAVQDILQSIPKHPGAPYPPGRDFFVSFMDFNALPPIESELIGVDWERGRYHFTAQAMSTQLMLGVMVGSRLTVNIRGTALSETRRSALAKLIAQLEDLCRDQPAQQLQIDSAIIAYLPSPKMLAAISPALEDDTTRRAIVAGFLNGDAARMVETTTTSLGTSGTILLGRFADELPSLPSSQLAQEVAAAVMVAAGHGARCISLAGLLPSWTGYGSLVREDLARHGHEELRLTTGHATTVVAMVQTVANLGRELELELSQTDVAVVGYGSIGQATIELLLDVIGSPRSLIICDTLGRLPHLADAVGRLQSRFGGPIEEVAAGSELPARVYQCGLILGASSEGGIVDVERLRPGAVVVDDSFPPIVEAEAALRRMREQCDVVVVSGGRLDVGASKRAVTVEVPEWVLERVAQVWEAGGMPGCRVESMLGASEPALPQIRGLVSVGEARRYWEHAQRLGLRIPPLRLLDSPIPPAALAGVRMLNGAARR